MELRTNHQNLEYLVCNLESFYAVAAISYQSVSDKLLWINYVPVSVVDAQYTD